MATVFIAVLSLLGGIGVFSVGMRVLSDGLKRSADKSIGKLFGKIRDNRFICVGIGAGVTAIVQSSTATTVMAVGLVGAGAITLFQASAIIMGANVGTTITGLLVSLSSLPINSFAMSLSFVGSIMLTMFKDELFVRIGTILCGIGLIFVGLYVMSGALAISQINNAFASLFVSLKSPLLLMLAGIVFTAIVQSSSATTGLLIILAGQGAISLNHALFLVLGTNVGTCITALISSFGHNVNAKRAALIHLIFNAFGLIFAIPLWLFKAQSEAFFQFLAPDFVGMQIAYFNIILNVVSVIVLLPFIRQINEVVMRLVKVKSRK